MISKTVCLYEHRRDVTLTAYIYSDSPELLKGKKRGAVLICPGGAYLNCSDCEAEPVAFRFASMGYHAFVLRYSTYFEGKKSFSDINEQIPVNKNSVFPNPMRDIAKAFLYINENAQEWLVDMDKIILCGFSAGAHNCAMYSVYWNDPVLTDYFHVKPEALKPAAAILGYTLSDYLLQKNRSNTQKDNMMKMLFDISNLAYTGEKEPNDEMLKRISPALHVSELTPPTFLWATAGDQMVSVEHSIVMAKALAEKHIPFEMHIFEEGMHGLSLANQASASAHDQINPDVSKWVGLVEQWLLKRFSLNLPEKTEWSS